jgi:hypothetical protein
MKITHFNLAFTHSVKPLGLISMIIPTQAQFGFNLSLDSLCKMGQKPSN